jgi:SAM-dependent methyltransferase
MVELVDPRTREPLELVADETAFVAPDGRAYPVRDGIARFTEIEDAGQEQTAGTFGFKWENTESYDDPAVVEELGAWLVARYGFADAAAMRAHFGRAGRILDAGCGSGLSATMWMTPDWRGDGDAQWVGLDISSAIDVARRRLADIPGTSFVQGDVTHPPFPPQSFDIVFSEGVMHHTPSTKDAFDALAALVRRGGEIMFYVYRRKAPLRELADDYLRGVLSPLPPEEAWAALRPLTRLAQALAEAKVEIEVPEDVPILGIAAGTHNVQRLVYWHFAKLFWNERLPFETNVHVNFDWYHPTYAHRQTEDEVRGWCADAGFTITHLDAGESGFTVRATRD